MAAEERNSEEEKERTRELELEKLRTLLENHDAEGLHAFVADENAIDFAQQVDELSDEEIEKHEFDEKLFTQYGFVSNSDSSKKISVKSDDGRSWQFDYKTNTIFYLDDTEKFFAVGEEPDRGRYFLFASEDLTKKSSGDRRYRGGYIGFVPDLFGGYYSLDDECVLTDLEGKNYYFNLVQE